jgi:hypothetical protein
MLEVRIGIGEADQYARRFEVYGDDARNLREPLGEIRDRIVESVGEQFMSEGAHGGTPWEALSEPYGTLKEEAFPGRPILVRGGAMRRKLLAPPDKGTIILTDSHLVWGIAEGATDAEGNRIDVRAAAHQTGGGVVPRRPWLALTHADRRNFDRILVRHMDAMKHRLFGVGR